jgi:hypothetical protein
VNFRLDESLLAIYERLGGVWLVVAVAILALAVFGSLLRGFGFAVLLMIGAQSWYTPAFLLGRNLRWWVLGIVCLRGLLAARRRGRGTSEPASVRFWAVALAGVALASALWSDRPVYTFGIAVSFVASIVAAFWVLWNLMDEYDIVAAASRGLLWLSLLVFGSGYLIVAVGTLTSEWTYVNHTGWGGRFAGVLFNANMGGLLGMVAVPALVAASRESLGWAAFLRWPAVALAATTIFMSGSRSAVLGTALSLVILFLYRFGVGAFFTVALGTVGMYTLVTTSDLSDIDATSVGHITRTGRLHNLSGRLELWEEGRDAVRGREVLGLGWGASRLLHGADPDEALERGYVRGASNLHSTHVQILVDLGLVGLGTLWMLCLQVLWSGWRLLLQPRSPRSESSVMVLACFVASLADTFVHGSVLSTGSPSAMIFWACCAYILKESVRLRHGTPPVHPTAAAATEARSAPGMLPR